MKNSIKRLVGAVLIAAICMPASFAADFTTVRVDNVDDFGGVSKRLRYADDKTPIPISGYSWDGKRVRHHPGGKRRPPGRGVQHSGLSAAV